MIALILATLALVASPGDEVLVSWDFAQGLQGWTANETAKVRQMPGAVAIETDGHDPILVSPPISFVARGR